MDVIEAILKRKSIRGFKPDPVPREIIREILTIATRAPSARNTQSWEITVVTGEVLDKIREENVAKLRSGDPVTNPDISVTPHEGKYRERQNELARQLFTLMGISREDREKRARWRERGLRFFDAPAVIIPSVEKSVERYQAQFEIGALAQTICLTALNYGLGTCIADAGISYLETIRKYIPIPESQRIVISIALGYPDWDFPANKTQTTREPIDNVVNWYGFD